MIRHNIPMIDDERLRQRLSVDNDCRDLNEFLEKFAFPVRLMQTKDDLQLIVFDLLKELKEQGLVYVEIRFAPQLHTQCGLTQDEAVRAALSGLDQFFDWQKGHSGDRPDLHANLLLCLMRLPDNEQENWQTIETAKHFLNRGVAGLDFSRS